MPMPPILPTIDWSHIFASGISYDTWIQQAQNQENRQKMDEALAGQSLSPQQEAWLAAIPRAVHVVAIAEDWCGDVVRHVPVLQRLAQEGGNIKIAYITREQHKDVFARFLTNGGEAIPKFIFLSDKFVECGNWGPMPDDCRKLIARGKASGDGKTARERVSALYAADPEKAGVVRELMDLLEIASAERP